MLFANREVLMEKTVADRGQVLSETWGLRPQAVFKPNVSAFVNTDRSSPANNVFILYGFETNFCVEF